MLQFSRQISFGNGLPRVIRLGEIIFRGLLKLVKGVGNLPGVGVRRHD